MKQVEYTDETERKWRVIVPDEACPEDYAKGIIVGPPVTLDEGLESLGWPEDLRVRLHNELFSRGILTSRDVQVRPRDVEGALRSTFKMALNVIYQLYYNEMGG